MGTVHPENTKARQDAFIAALYETGGFVTYAYKAAKIPAQTYYDWMNGDPEFNQRVKHNIYVAKEETIDLAESELVKAIRDRTMTAIIYYLKTQAKHRGYHEDGSTPQITISKEDFNTLLNKLADETRADH